MSAYLCVSDGYTVDAALTMKPVNRATFAGTRVTLRCTTDQLRSSVPIAWRRNPDTVVDRIVNFNCQPDSAFPEYNVSSTSAGQCDLVINAASLALAATYSCLDDTGGEAGSATAEFTVIGESYCVNCLFNYLKSMSYTKYTYKKENVHKQAPLKNIYKHINLKKN